MDQELALDTTRRIARRIAEQATWQDDVCTWQIQVTDRSQPEQRKTLSQAASPDLYQGSAGIAFFLAEASKVLAEDHLAEVARGGIRHALDADPGHGRPFSFHNGPLGIAWVSTRMAQILDDAELRSQAIALLEPLMDPEQRDSGMDVIAGAAGAIPALLELAQDLEQPELVEIARRLGDGLLAQAHREPLGWSWSTMGRAAVRNLCGLAHGVAGIGLALLELAQATGDGRYLFAAEMAFLHERQFFHPDASNWLDLRNSVLNDFITYGRIPQLREALQAGQAPTWHPHFMTAWCHGAPGIGLCRLRAFELTGEEIYRKELGIALGRTRDSIRQDASQRTNFSQCHGIGGNCELPISAAHVLDDPTLLEESLEAAHLGRETWELAGEPWPCGTLSSATDPSLMLGEAGIGLFYLRLAHPETPTPLLLRPDPTESTTLDEEGYRKAAEEAVDDYFRLSRRVVSILAPDRPLETRATSPLARSPVECAHEDLAQSLNDLDEPARRLIEDASKLERERYRSTLAIDDFTTEFLEGLVRPPWEDLEPRTSRFRRPEHSHLVTLDHDWATWLDNEPTKGSPVEEEQTFLLHRRANRIHFRPLSPFAELLLEATETPRDFEELVDHGMEATGGGIERDLLAGRIEQQLEQLYRAGLVDQAPSASP